MPWKSRNQEVCVKLKAYMHGHTTSQLVKGTYHTHHQWSRWNRKTIAIKVDGIISWTSILSSGEVWSIGSGKFRERIRSMTGEAENVSSGSISLTMWRGWDWSGLRFRCDRWEGVYVWKQANGHPTNSNSEPNSEPNFEPNELLLVPCRSEEEQEEEEEQQQDGFCFLFHFEFPPSRRQNSRCLGGASEKSSRLLLVQELCSSSSSCSGVSSVDPMTPPHLSIRHASLHNISKKMRGEEAKEEERHCGDGWVERSRVVSCGIVFTTSALLNAATSMNKPLLSFLSSRSPFVSSLKQVGGMLYKYRYLDR